MKLEAIQPYHLNQFYAQLEAPGANKRTGQGLSPRTILGIHSVICSVLEMACREGLVAANIAKRAILPKPVNKEIDPLEIEQIKAVMELLKQWQTEQVDTFGKLGIVPTHDLVITANNGKPLMPIYCSNWISRFAKRHKLPPLRPHLFRHSLVSLLLETNLDIASISKRLGHSRIGTTINVYSHAMNRSDAKVTGVVTDLMYTPDTPAQDA